MAGWLVGSSLPRTPPGSSDGEEEEKAASAFLPTEYLSVAEACIEAIVHEILIWIFHVDKNELTIDLRVTDVIVSKKLSYSVIRTKLEHQKTLRNGCFLDINYLTGHFQFGSSTN